MVTLAIGLLVGYFQVFDTLAKQNQSIFNGSYYLLGTKLNLDDDLSHNQLLISKAKAEFSRQSQILNDFMRDNKLEDSSLLPSITNPITNNDGKESVDFNSPIGAKILSNYLLKKPQQPLQAGSLESKSISPIQQLSPSSGTISTYVNGSDPLIANEKPSRLFTDDKPLIVEKTAVAPYISFDLSKLKDDQIPLLIPYSYVNDFVKLSMAPNDTLAKQISAIDEAKRKIIGTSIHACYRDSLETKKIQNELNNENMTLDTKSRENLEKNCTPLHDFTTSRTLKQTTYDNKIASLYKQLEEKSTSSTKDIEFIIVGVLPDTKWFESTNSDISLSLLSILKTESINMPLIPIDLTNHPLIKNGDLSVSERISNGASYSMYMVSYSSEKSMLDAYTNQNCPLSAIQCPDTKPLHLSEYGTNTIKVHNFKAISARVIIVILIVLLILSIVVVGGVFINIITDNGKEIATYLALGASKNMIVCMYAMYASTILFLSILTSIAIVYIVGYSISSLHDKIFDDAVLYLYGVTHQSLFSPAFHIEILILSAIFFLTVMTSVMITIRRESSKSIRHLLSSAE